MILNNKTLLRQTLKTSMTIIIGISILVMIVQPAIAWGTTAHMAIDSNLKGVPKVIKSYPAFTRGGGIGPDLFFSMQNSEKYSVLAHTIKSADLGREMLKLASDSHSNSKKAFSYGWLSHGASDIVGHKYYVIPRAGTDINLHYQVEIGVDANVLSETSTSFSIPYKLIQDAYTNIYGDKPSYSEIYIAAQRTGVFVFLEKDLIESGFFDDLKQQYSDYGPTYQDSINYSEKVINDPSILPNANLGTGTSTISGINSDTDMVRNINNAIMIASKDSLENNAVDVIINDHKTNHYLSVKQPTIKDIVLFEKIKNDMKESIKQKYEQKPSSWILNEKRIVKNDR